MAMRPKSRPTTGGGGVGGEETSSTRKRIQDVLGQARATLRQSQQFRWNPLDKKNNNIGSKLAFQQKQQDDYWSSENAGEVIQAESLNPLYEGPRPSSKTPGKAKAFLHQDDDFGLPFRDAMNRTVGPKLLGSTREQQQRELGVKEDGSSDSITMDTTELKISAEDDESDGDQTVDTISSTGTLRKAPSKVPKVSKEVKVIEPPPAPPQEEVITAAVTMVPSPLKLNPLANRSDDDKSDNDDDYLDDHNYVLPTYPHHTTTITVLADDLGFSRASIKKPVEDPHWFEKALLVRKEPISEAAYKAFKQAHEDQESSKKNKDAPPIQRKRITIPPPAPPSLGGTSKEPEFTADWMSELDIPSYASDLDVPEEISSPELLSAVEDEASGMPELVEDLDDKTVVDEANTESIVRTATELEASGVLSEITSNLQSVLDVSDKPATPDFSRMSAEERSFAREYDEVLQDRNEPLGSIFHSVFPGKHGETEDPISKSLGLSNRDREEEDQDQEDEEEGQYENTFISNASSSYSRKSLPTKSSLTLSKSTYSRKTLQSKSTTSRTAQSKSKSSVGAGKSTTTATTSGMKDQNQKKVQKETTPSQTKSKGRVSSSETNSTVASSSMSSSTTSKVKLVRVPPGKNVSFHNSKSSTSSRKSSLKLKETMTSRRIAISRKPSTDTEIATPSLVMDPPANRYQKNIQTILEKEVYEKELKRRRSERLKEERRQDRLKQIAKESMERNKVTTWKEPTHTEILLPELFKYKSVSGLEAAKATKSKSDNFRMNYGAPYFQLSGAVDDTEGTGHMLAQAQVESLDIPDLVREVLASNERMYRMTVEASRQMNKAYKEKINRKR